MRQHPRHTRAIRPIFFVGILLLTAACGPGGEEGALPTLAQLDSPAANEPDIPDMSPTEPATPSAGVTPVAVTATPDTPPTSAGIVPPTDPPPGETFGLAEMTPETPMGEETTFDPPLAASLDLPASYEPGDTLRAVGQISSDGENGPIFTDGTGASIALLVDDFLLNSIGEQQVEVTGTVVTGSANPDELALQVESARVIEADMALGEPNIMGAGEQLPGVTVEPGQTALATYDALSEQLGDELAGEWVSLDGNARLGWTYTFRPAAGGNAITYAVAPGGGVTRMTGMPGPDAADAPPALDRTQITIDSDTVSERLIEAGYSPIDVTLTLSASETGDPVWRAVDFSGTTVLTLDAVSGTIEDA